MNLHRIKHGPSQTLKQFQGVLMHPWHDSLNAARHLGIVSIHKSQNIVSSGDKSGLYIVRMITSGKK